VGRRVFISYAHDNDDHVESVRRFWELLRAAGVDARLDLPAATVRRDWPVWMMGEFRRAEVILVIASPAYRRRAEGEADPDEGRGVQFEGALLRELIYADRRAWFSRVLPVVLPGQSQDGIPIFLGPVSGSVYRLSGLAAADIEPVLRVINGPAATGLAAVAPSAVVSTPAAPARVTASGAGAGGPRRSTVAEAGELATALGAIVEFGDRDGRRQALALLPPGIREHIDDAPTARMHLLAIVRGCARFGEAGRAALLDLLRDALPAADPAVARAIALVVHSRLFDDHEAV